MNKVFLFFSLFLIFSSLGVAESDSGNSFVFEGFDSLLSIGDSVDQNLDSQIQEITFATVLIALATGIIYIVSYGDTVASLMTLIMGIISAVLVDGYYPQWIGLIIGFFIVVFVARIVVDMYSGDS